MANDPFGTPDQPFNLWKFPFGGGSQNNNPYTAQLLPWLGGQQQSNMGKMNELISSSLNNFDPTNFLKQFMNNAGGLSSLANQDYSDMMKGAKDVGQNAVQDVAGQFAGLGSIYSGGAANSATEALATPMMGAYNTMANNRNSLLQSLFGGAMSGLEQGNVSQMQGGLQAAGMYGNLAGSLNTALAGYGTPQNSATQGLWQMLQSMLSNAGSAASGAAALKTAGLIG